MNSVAHLDVCRSSLPAEEANASKTRLFSKRFETDTAPSLSLLPPRFRVLEKLGQGGMGVVHRAVDCELGREIALKALGAPRADDLYRLKKEFRLLADLRHPNIIRLHELFADDCRACFTMDLVIGSDLYAFTHRRESCDFRALRAAAKQLASALGAVHAAGKLHRDVKLSNVLVTSAGRVVLFDFGLAARIAPATSKTKGAGILLGTRGYISPEQTRGEALTTAADWYGFGVTLFEAAAGRRPFDDPFKGISVERRVDGWERLSRLIPDVPPDLDELIAGLLDPVARRRPDESQVMSVLGGASLGDKTKSGPPKPAAHAVEARALADAFDRLGRGRAGVLRVYGRGGADKSTIIERFLDEREALGTLVLRGRCRLRERVPFNAVDEVVDGLSHALEHMPYAELLSALPRHASALTHLFPVLGRLEAMTDGKIAARNSGGNAETRRLARGAMKELLSSLAAGRPLVVWIDDAQWVDRESAELLRELLAPETPRLLLLLSYRCESDACAHGALNDLFVEPRARCA